MEGCWHQDGNVRTVESVWLCHDIGTAAFGGLIVMSLFSSHCTSFLFCMNDACDILLIQIKKINFFCF